MSTEPSLAEINVNLIGEADLVVAQRQAVAEDKAAVEGLKTDVETIQQDVTAKQQQVAENLLQTEGHKDTAAALDQSATETLVDITERQADVIARQNNIITRQEDIVTRQDDVTRKQGDVTEQSTQVSADKNHVDAVKTAFDASVAQATTEITTEGDSQTGRVTNEGGTQTARVTTEGDSQVARVIAEGDTQKTQTQLLVDQAEIAKTDSEAIAAQFGNLDTLTTGIDNQLITATAEANRSTAQANLATTQKTQAEIAKNESIAAKEQALAIVHEDAASEVAEAGKYPVGGPSGLDTSWTPLLAAMYPNSGVIGSVDKLDLLTFKTDTAADADKITVKPRQFNIAGRFVDVPETVVTLDAAESTAERAIAFDDVFLDWDGNVLAYRSITPHRTATSFDRDAIAAKHGYSKVSTGLYKNGDTYALLLGRVARRNLGAYHPVFNREGAKKFKTSAPSEVYWHDSGLSINSPTDCFTPSNVWGDSGQIAVPGTNKSKYGSPNKKPYDAIYADDFTPLYYSAKNVIDRQALMTDSFNRALAGETFMGAEGCKTYHQIINQSKPYTEQAYIYSSGNNTFINADSFGITNAPAWSDNIKIRPENGYNDLTGAKVRVEFDIVISNGTANLWHYNTEVRINRSLKSSGHKVIEYALEPDAISGDLTFIGASNNTTFEVSNVSYFIESSTSVARPQFLMCDIIGSLEAMPQEWLDHGIPGNWLAVGEEGESLIPDGTSKNFKLSRKCLECYQVLKTSDNGVTWSDATSTHKTDIESATNSMGNLSFAATDVYMVFYRTSANPFELVNNDTVLCVDQIGVFSHSNPSEQFGTTLASDLIGKVPTGNGARFSKLESWLYYKNAFRKIYAHPIHSSIVSGLSVGSPAVKVLPYLSDSSSDAFTLQCVYKEIKHNGTQWGDDNTFNIVDKQTTVTDLNGEEVIVGQKRVELPYIFDGEQY